MATCPCMKPVTPASCFTAWPAQLSSLNPKARATDCHFRDRNALPARVCVPSALWHGRLTVTLISCPACPCLTTCGQPQLPNQQQQDKCCTCNRPGHEHLTWPWLWKESSAVLDDDQHLQSYHLVTQLTQERHQSMPDHHPRQAHIADRSKFILYPLLKAFGLADHGITGPNEGGAKVLHLHIRYMYMHVQAQHSMQRPV